MFFKWGKKLSTLHFSKKKKRNTISPPPPSTFQDRQERREFFPLSPDCSSVHTPPPLEISSTNLFLTAFTSFPFLSPLFFFLSPELRIWENGGGEKKVTAFACEQFGWRQLVEKASDEGGRERKQTRELSRNLFFVSIDAWQNLLNSR